MATKKHLPHRTHLALFIAIAIGVTGYLQAQISRFSNELNIEHIEVAHAAGSATLSLSPTSSTVALNQNFTVNINLNTAGGAIDGVDVYALKFNPAILQVVDSNSSATGVQIAPGTLLYNTAINTVDNAAGRILFSQSTEGGTTYTGSGVLATITFRAIAGGTAAVTFDFTLNSNTDTNVASQGVDQLGSVTNANFTVDASSPTVSISSPSNGSTVSGTTTVTASASDNVGVVGVQFKLDGANLGTEDTSSPYSVSWNTTSATNASHVLTAVARDAAGNTTTSSSVNVTVSNAVFGFNLSNTGAKTVTQGSSVTNVITASLTSGNAQSVTFSASGLPSGVTASFSAPSCTPTCNTTLTLNAAASATVGASTITVSATGGSQTDTTTFSLTVNSATYSRTFNIASIEARSSKAISGTVEVLNSARSLLKSYPFTSNSSGNATISLDLSPTTVFLKLKVAPFLTRVISVNLNSATLYSFPALLIGDINQDNIINSVDYSVLNINWFTSNATADLNQDGLVNSVDYSYLNQHWLITGEQ